MHDSELFDDAYFWNVPPNVLDAYKTEKGPNDLEFGKLKESGESHDVVCGNGNNIAGTSRSKVVPQ